MLVVQRELSKHVVLEAGYLGGPGTSLASLCRDQPGRVPDRPGRREQQPRVPRRPWPLLGAVQEMMDVASSNYHSLEGKLNHRFSNGLVYSLGITWMKSIDYGSAVRGGYLWPYNSYDLQQLRGPSDFDVPLRFTAEFRV